MLLLAGSLPPHCGEELGRRITLEVAKWLKEGKSVAGLWLFRIVVRYYATGRTAEALYNINDLQRIRVKDLEEFMNTWEMVLEGMRVRPPDEQLEFIFYEAIKEYRAPGIGACIREDIAHYNRLEEGAGGDRSYQFLVDSANRCIKLQRQAANREDIEKALEGKTPKDRQSPACPAESSGTKKKLLCRYFQEGKCSQGEKCNYSHDIPNSPKGEGKGKSQKTKGPCAYFFKHGTCKWGEKCFSSHAEKDRPAAPENQDEEEAEEGEAAEVAPKAKPKAKQR
jgi:hypothetical protein